MKKDSIDAFVKELSQSVKAVRHNKYLIVFPVLLDFLFPIAYGFIAAYFGGSIIDGLYSLGASMLQAETSGMTDTARGIIYALIGFAAASYAAYVLLQGLSWKYSSVFSGMSGRKSTMSILVYLKRFAAVNLLWFALISLHSTASFLIDYHDLRSSFLSALLYIYLAALVYFALISYTLLDKGSYRAVSQSFIKGFNNAVRILPRMLFAAAVLVIVNYAVISSAMISRNIMIIMGVILLLPIVTWARVYLHIVIKNA
ncbi:hypothetical protein GF345_05205 [Candidatus Woesearchaeota archaeon]|nr:hypothetical protein [Candidatus Woesearchaeota archaeon]